MKKNFSFIIALFLLAFVSSYCFAANPIEEQHHKSRHQQKKEGEEFELSGKLENGIRIIEVKASRYKFEPDPIVVRLGEKVRLIVTSTDVAHGIAIQEFNVKLSVPAGETERIEFIADKQGEFHAYCSVYCGPGHGHMHASFIVK
ncbi:MAG: cupredoxin domain-containing protein [Candidatus Omnitrophota bacterium]